MLQIKTKKLSPISYILLIATLVFTSLISSSVAKASDDDPLEPMNRAIFGFNEVVDDAILEPVAEGYRYITPDPIEDSISNFFNNLGEINTIVNSALQLKLDKTISSSSRDFIFFQLFCFVNLQNASNATIFNENLQSPPPNHKN